jgi:hypothetical protein
MKKIIFLLSVLCISCEDVVTIDLPKAPDQIVIDAELSRPQGGGAGSLRVDVTKTTDFYSTEITSVSDAFVSLQYDDKTLDATHIGDGQYTLDVPEITIDKEYQLVVDVNGDRYTATEELVLSGTFDSAIQGDGQLFSGNETEVLVTLTDRPGLGNFYLFDFSENNLFVTRDRFYDGQPFTFSFFYDELFPKNEEVTIRMVGIDEAFFTYMQILLSHSGQGGGGPFATATSTLLGNIVSSKKDDVALGYFRVVEYSALPFTAE